MPEVSGVRLDPTSAALEQAISVGFLEATALGYGEATGEHVILSSVSSQVTWARPSVECGCLVTTVSSSAGLCCQEVRSLLGVPHLGFLLRKELPGAFLGH